MLSKSMKDKCNDNRGKLVIIITHVYTVNID